MTRAEADKALREVAKIERPGAAKARFIRRTNLRAEAISRR
jgi:hypothetical protein